LEVVLIAYTPNPEEVCAKAMRSCRKKLGMHKIKLEKPVEYYIKLAKKSGHDSVLEHAVFTFSVEEISRVTTHQLVRHRIASYSQLTSRTVKADSMAIPDSILKNPVACKLVEEWFIDTFTLYNELIDKYKIRIEDARYILPFGMFSNIVVTMNARELIHFFKMRLYPPAQWEIRELAHRMLKEVKEVAPTIFEDIT